MTNLNTLPSNTIAKVKDTLKAYDKVYVVYENGEYNVSVGIALKASYAPDHKVIGTYTADEVYTEEEKMINYIETFHDYPHNYKGKRNYGMLREIERNWDAKFKFDNGNLVLA